MRALTDWGVQIGVNGGNPKGCFKVKAAFGVS
jgi:hypothetical protein